MDFLTKKSEELEAERCKIKNNIINEKQELTNSIIKDSQHAQENLEDAARDLDELSKDQFSEEVKQRLVKIVQKLVDSRSSVLSIQKSCYKSLEKDVQFIGGNKDGQVEGVKGDQNAVGVKEDVLEIGEKLDDLEIEQGPKKITGLDKQVELENYVFPIDDLPYPAFRNVIKHLGMEDIHNFMLSSKENYYKVGKMVPSTGKWKIRLTPVSFQSYMETLKAAKKRQNIRPRKIEIKIEINCCSYWQEPHLFYGHDPKDCGYTYDCLEMKREIFQDWSENLTSLKMEILGNELFLMDQDIFCPNVDSLVLEVYPEKMSPSAKNIIQAVIKKHAHNLKSLEIIGDYTTSTVFEIPPSLPVLASCKLTNLPPQTLCSVLNSSYQTLNSLAIDAPKKGNDRVNLKNKFKNVEHLLLHHVKENNVPACKALVQHLAPQLITLKLDTIWQDFNFLNNCKSFPKVKLLWISGGFDLQYLNKFVNVEVLLTFLICNGSKKHAVKMPNLRELVVEEIDEWSLEMIRLNAGTLEILMVLQPNANYELVSYQLPKLKHLYMMECKTPAAIDHMTTKCPLTCEVVKESLRAYSMMMKQAETYPFPKIAKEFDEKFCMLRDEYIMIDDDEDYDFDYSSADFYDYDYPEGY